MEFYSGEAAVVEHRARLDLLSDDRSLLLDEHGHLVVEVGAPRTIQGFTLNPRGTIDGSEPTPSNSLMSRLPQDTPIPNLFLAGAWTFPGPGQASVLQSGEMAAKKILAIEAD